MINLCFPISLTALIFILGWPHVILYQFGYKAFTELLDVNFIAIGALVNLVIAFIIGTLIDTWRRKKGYLQKKYYIKLPFLITIIGLLLFVVSYIDRSCV